MKSLSLPDDLIRAALAGRLTEIRVPVKPQPDIIFNGLPWRPTERGPWVIGGPFGSIKHGRIRCPLGEPRERVRIREASLPDRGRLIYRADGTPLPAGSQWRSSAQMPPEATRLWFEVDAIRVERVQDITETGALASGIRQTGPGVTADGALVDPRPLFIGAGSGWWTAKEAFAARWELHHAKAFPWASNPLVWVSAGRVARKGEA